MTADLYSSFQTFSLHRAALPKALSSSPVFIHWPAATLRLRVPRPTHCVVHKELCAAGSVPQRHILAEPQALC